MSMKTKDWIKRQRASGLKLSNIRTQLVNQYGYDFDTATEIILEVQEELKPVKKKQDNSNLLVVRLKPEEVILLGKKKPSEFFHKVVKHYSLCPKKENILQDGE